MCFPGSPPESTGESAGSTAIILVSGLSSLSLLPTFESVLAVPTPET